ncbi:S41 family peptidase [Streptomyces thermolineatus]|uniref:Tricorn protease homolog n=1 Tax=Streptomyces thermolineatus TaxID=44033 RepID=A0ABN3MJC1_9ACTN
MSDEAYLRFPHLHGDLLCFVAEDDLWLAPLAPGGGTARAWRLTADRTRTGPPRFSPDGSSIACTHWRSLDPEIHLVPVGGGPARRLTHWGSVDARVCGWLHRTGEGTRDQVLAVSSHAQPFPHFSRAYAVPPEGGPGARQPWGPVSDIAVGTLEGRRQTLLLTGRPPHEPASWKRYRGGATGRLWLQGTRLLPGLCGSVSDPMIVAGRVAFLSDHEGIGNLYSCRADGSDLRRHTDHDAFYARHASTDGRRVVYQCAGGLWLADDLEDPAAVPRRLDVRLGGPRTGRRAHQVPAAANLDDFACDTAGRASAVCVRGSLYWITHRDGPARVLSDVPGVRVRLPEMLGTSGRVAWVTDAEGEDAIETADLPGQEAPAVPAELFADQAGAAEPPEPGTSPGSRDAAGGTPGDAAGGSADGTPGDAAGGAPHGTPPGASRGAAVRLAAGRLGRVRELVSSPDGRTLAVAAHDGRLLLVSAATGEVTELVRASNGPVRHLAFAPDSNWLAWSHPGVGRSLRRIRMAELSGERRLVDVTDDRFEDEQPVFTRDGKYLAFLSWRGFDPVYDVHTGDLSFPLGCRPYLVPLSADVPSPFALPVDGRPGGAGAVPGGSGGDGRVVVEPEGLASRVVPFPVSASKYSSLAPVHGGLVWLRWPLSGVLGETFANPADTSGRPALEHFDPAKGVRTELAAHVDRFRVGGDGMHLVVEDAGELRVVPATERDVSAEVVVDLRRILHEADPAAEWRQAYAEAGRIVRDHFWDPGMGGTDWPAVLEQYRPLVERVASPGEFADLLREVMGELGTSHAYVTPSRRSEGPPHYQRPIGLLGADFRRTPDGSWAVARILPGESSDPRARSPLAGTGVREGDLLVGVDGRPVDPAAGPWPLLSGAGGTTVELTFAPAPSDPPRPPRRVAVVPLVDDRALRYQDWVAHRRRVVREMSGGRCGYLHIPDMGGSGWAQFNRDLRTEVSLPALIVDVRGNAGGHISELVVDKLTRTILGWDHTRDAEPVSYASNAPRGPVVALADEATSSDGDMITAAFKLLGLGPVVGVRTWGGVVGTTGRHRLGDGTVITVPMNAAWFDAYGWSVENHGVEPDIEVLRTPVDWAEGRNSQLSAAVRTALELLEKHPVSGPPGLSGLPDRSRPPLPPRPAP